jgi:NADH:ubiquinone oxidoreductase subunit 2 (subunit N)
MIYRNFPYKITPRTFFALTLILSIFMSIALPSSVAAVATPFATSPYRAPGQINTFSDLVVRINEILNTAVPLLIALAVVWTIWAAFKMISAEGDNREEARKKLIWGIVGIFIMVSVWGLVNLLITTFNLNNAALPVPRIR